MARNFCKGHAKEVFYLAFKVLDGTREEL